MLCPCQRKYNVIIKYSWTYDISNTNILNNMYIMKWVGCYNRYCNPTFIHVWEISAMFAKSHCCEYFWSRTFLPYTCRCTERTGVDKNWPWKLVAANQFISGNLQNIVVANNSGFTVFLLISKPQFLKSTHIGKILLDLNELFECIWHNIRYKQVTIVTTWFNQVWVIRYHTNKRK